MKNLLKFLHSNNDFKTKILNYVNAEKESYGKDELNSIHKTGGVYIAFDKKKAIYVGRSKNLKNRIRQQLTNSVKTSSLRKYYKTDNPTKSDIEIHNYFLKNITFKYFESENHIERCHIEYLLTALFETQFVHEEH